MNKKYLEIERKKKEKKTRCFTTQGRRGVYMPYFHLGFFCSRN
jgi:hypothetical protein